MPEKLYTLREIPTRIDFELKNGTTLEFDISTYLQLIREHKERLYALAKSDDEEAIRTLESEWTLPLLRPHIESAYFDATSEPLSESIFIMIYNAIMLGISAFKKKLSDSLVLGSGTIPIQPVSHLPKWKLSIITWIFYFLRETSTLEKLKPLLLPKTSTTTSSSKPNQ
jgi:hypothetical protein